METTQQDIELIDKELVDIDAPRETAPAPSLDEWRRNSTTVAGYLSYKEKLGDDKFEAAMEKTDSFLHDIDQGPIRSALDTDPDSREEEETPEELIGWLDGERVDPPATAFTDASLLSALTGKNEPIVALPDDEDEVDGWEE